MAKKFSTKKMNISNMGGALVGGAAGGFVNGFMPDSWNEYIKNGLLAVAGAAVSTYMQGDLLKGLGTGMLGVAGANITTELLGNKPVATSGWQRGVQALGNANVPFLPSQRAIGAPNNWIQERTVAAASSPVPKVTSIL